MKIEWVKTADLTPRPNNRNSHPEEQIDRLAKIVDHNGFRVPIIVSKLSGLVVAGHGRLEAAKRLGLEKVPVIYQDFASEDEEYQFHVADNGIARWAELDLSGINADLENIGPIDIDLLGIKDFMVDFNEKVEISDAEFGIFAANFSGNSSGSRQINLVFDPEEFDHFSKRLKKIMIREKLETTKDVFVFLMGKYEESNS